MRDVTRSRYRFQAGDRDGMMNSVGMSWCAKKKIILAWGEQGCSLAKQAHTGFYAHMVSKPLGTIKPAVLLVLLLLLFAVGLGMKKKKKYAFLSNFLITRDNFWVTFGPTVQLSTVSVLIDVDIIRPEWPFKNVQKWHSFTKMRVVTQKNIITAPK